jgi:excinuclease ABC subunit C
LKNNMYAAAEKMEFEKAARIRDQFEAVKQVLAKQKMVSVSMDDQDVIAMARGINEACVQVFFVRAGKVIGREHYFMKQTDALSRKEILTEFVKQYYNSVDDIPKGLVLEEELGEKEIIQKWLSEKRGSRVIFRVPKKGEKLRLVQMVSKNALMLLKEEELLRRKKNMASEEAILNIQKFLNLDKPPIRIECYDISNISGYNSVGSMVVFENGKPKNSEYRRFKIKTVEGPNDFASMKEVLYRRFKNAKNNSTGSFSVLPDLIIIDGGKGQLSSALEVMRVLNINIPIFGLAKKEELLFEPGNIDPIRIPENSEALFMIQRIRDEAHRFAISYHRNLREKSFRKSALDEIPGIGPKRKKALLKYFGSVEKIKNANLQELNKINSIDKKTAENIKKYFS